ncbi:MAG: DNA repair protein RecN [Gammaproteobacteria bacterium RBG_16_51_14]|nr:MAG: DNA repair protein RecN [Gammaproteobacteria bacterium RBG_16_51_14]
MLRQLIIRDFAVIETLDLQFQSGMIVFTGETGAGKSILVDAMALVLGDRADNTIIRGGCDRTEITAVFSTEQNHAIRVFLDEQGIEYDDEILIRRIINKEGRSRAFINGTPVPLQLLRELGEQLVDIHGQNTHQSLSRRDVQRSLIDDFGQHEGVLQEVKQSWKEWHEATTQLAALTVGNSDHEAHIALLRYQIQELDLLQLEPSEYQKLSEEHSRLANVNRLLGTSQQALNDLSENEKSIASRLDLILRELQALQTVDPSLSAAIGFLENATIQIDEARDELRQYTDHLDLDPERLQVVEKRLDVLHDMARKHRVRPEDLDSHLNRLADELKHHIDNSNRGDELRSIQSRALDLYYQHASKLNACRKTAIKEFTQAVTKKIHALGMDGSIFQIEMESVKDHDPSPYGMDHIEFLITTNPGQPLRSLGKVASGGELSRISLAIRVTGSQDKGIQTLVFDEVDAGIGGGVAEIVGDLLHELAKHRQVFCVTHLPQIASLADHHMQVQKLMNEKQTFTLVNELNKNERVDEIARMLGGIRITDQSRAHAMEMLNPERGNLAG